MNDNTVKIPHLIVRRAVTDGRSECVWLWLLGKKMDADNHDGHAAGWVEIAELKKSVAPAAVDRIVADGAGLFWMVSPHDSPRLFLFGYTRVVNECNYGFYNRRDRMNIPIAALLDGHEALADAVGIGDKNG